MCFTWPYLILQPSSNGGRCQPGFFCPVGSFEMTQCTPGKYCKTVGLAAPTGDCNEGYYCPLGSTEFSQERCPVGHYCPIGSPEPTACRNGTYGPVEGLRSEGECEACDGGYFCNGTGLSAITGECDAGRKTCLCEM